MAVNERLIINFGGYAPIGIDNPDWENKHLKRMRGYADTIRTIELEGIKKTVLFVPIKSHHEVGDMLEYLISVNAAENLAPL